MVALIIFTVLIGAGSAGPADPGRLDEPAGAPAPRADAGPIARAEGYDADRWVFELPA